MPAKSTGGRDPAEAHNGVGAQRPKSAAPRSALGHAPVKPQDRIASGSPAASSQRVGRATKGPVGATTASLSKYASTTNNPAASARLAAARAQLTSRLANPAYQESLGRAANRFKGFKLSKFARRGMPDNYIDPTKLNDRTAVHAKQKELIARQLEHLKDKETPNRGLTLTFPVDRLDEVKNALSGIGEKGGKIELQHLLTYLCGHMNGTSFCSRGNSETTRLTTEMRARSTARKMIEKIKKRAAKEVTGVTTGKSSQEASFSTNEEAHGHEKRRGSHS